MSNYDVLNANITGFFNQLLKFSYPNDLSKKIDGNLFDEILSLNYNKYNNTVYIETPTHYFVLEYLQGVNLRVTEFEKPKKEETL